MLWRTDEEGDFFLMTSRLDPLPNVSIDAMISTPMLCFDKGRNGKFNVCDGTREYLVASYLDVNEIDGSGANGKTEKNTCK